MQQIRDFKKFRDCAIRILANSRKQKYFMEDDSLGLQQTQRPARVDESALVFQFVISIVSDLFVQQTWGDEGQSKEGVKHSVL